VKFLCEQCKAKYQIADEKVVGRTVRMKCRKCGHMIEVRAAVTESSVSTESAPPPPARPAPKAAPPPPRPPPPKGAPLGAAPPKAAAPLATGLTAAKAPPAKADRGAGALAGAFKTNVQREEEVSAPFDMSDLSPGDGWYVAINGVPVGPIRMSEVRRKAALGAVTEDSLVWQEGLDEWRPARSLPELAAIVREAASSGRTSLTPPPPAGRLSTPPPPRAQTTSTRPVAPGGIAPRSPRPPASALPAAARSNVVPIMSRLATAERLDEAPAEGRTSSPPRAPEIQPAVVADPFAPSAAPAVAASGSVSIAPAQAPKKPIPWFAVAMVAGTVTFGLTLGVTMGLNHAPAAAPAPTAAAPTGLATTAATNTAAATASPEPTTSTTQAGPKTPIAGGGGPKAIATAAATASAAGGRSLDLHSLTQNSNVAPAAEDLGDGPKAPGQCFSQGQVQSVIALHQVAIRRSCWERDPTTKPTVNVSVSMTIGTDGSPQGVAASGDEGSVAKCIENDVRGWHFPAMGCSQKTGFSFKFVRQ
jgi:predicted Zn finger-like uncharacterized protein